MKPIDIHRISDKLYRIFEKCSLCPRECGVDRLKGGKGFCGSGAVPAVFSSGPHHGEEPPLSGKDGSGTIFFTGCTMSCVYCQNYKFSQAPYNESISGFDLSDMMLSLERTGCHNINLVSPTHHLPGIVRAIGTARGKGLKLPVVYNTSGYESLKVLELLSGIIDIYLPDMRYSDDTMALKYSNAPRYVENNRICVKEMYRQAGGLETDNNGIARRGLIVRCLVLPNNISGTPATLQHISRDISKSVFISLMSQYYPIYKAGGFKEIAGKITEKEYLKAVSALSKYGLHNGWVQESPVDMGNNFGGHMITPGEMRFK